MWCVVTEERRRRPNESEPVSKTRSFFILIYVSRPGENSLAMVLENVRLF